MADGKIVIETGVDSKGAEKDLKGITGKLGNVAKTGLNAITGLVTGTSAAIGALGALGVQYNSDMERYITNFEVMLGSTENALKHVEDLKQFAAKTPFAMSGLAEASSLLLQFGTDIDDIMPTLQMLGDISLGDSEKLKGLALVFAQVQSQGKLTGQDLMQMINNGFNPLKIISEQTGKSMADLKEEMSDGAISFEMVADAMRIATTEGGLFYQGMEKQSQTMSGLISTLKDNAMSLIGEVFIPISDNIKNNILPTTLGYVAELEKAFQLNGVKGLVAKFGEIGGEIVANISKSLPSIVNSGVEVVKSFVKGIKSNLKTIVTGAIEIMQSLSSGIVQLLPMLLEVGLQAIIQFGQGISQNIGSIIPQVINLVITIADTIINNLPILVSTALQIIVALAQGLIEALPTLIAEVPRIINEFANGIYNSLPTIITTGIQVIVSLVSGLINAIPVIVENMPQIIMAIINAFTLVNWVNLGKNLITNIGQGIKAMVASIKNIATNMATSVKDSIVNLFSGGASWGKNLITNIGNGISSMVSSIVNIGKSMATSVKDAIVNLFSGGASWGQNLITNIGNGIKGMISSIVGIGKNMATSVIDGIKYVFANAADIGKNLVQGIWYGIKNMGGWIIEKIRGFANNIIGKIKDFFGIHSPSVIMENLIGVNLVKGIGVGVDKETARLQRAVIGNMSELVQQMQSAVRYETSKTSNALASRSGVVSNNNTTVTNNNDNGVTLNIDKFENNSDSDIETLAEEIAFVIRNKGVWA